MVQMRDLAKNLSFQVVGRMVGVVLGLVSVGILTRHLGSEGYGQFTIAMTFLQIFGVIVDFGLTLTLVQMISEPGADEKRLVGNILALRLISAVIFFALAPVVALAFPYASVIKYAILIGAFSYLFMTTAQMMIGIFQKHLVMWRVALAELINRSALLILVAIFAFNGLGLLWMVAAFVISNLIHLVSTVVLAKPYVKISLRMEPAVWRETVTRSWPIGLSIFFNLIYLKGDIIFLSLFRSQAEVGLYGAAYKIVDVVTSIPVMFMGLALPPLVARWKDRALTDFRKLSQQTFDLFSVFALPLAFGVQVVGVPLMIFIAGPDFALSGTVAKILIPAASIVFFGSLYGHLIVAVQKQKPMVWGYLITAIFSILGYLIFIPKYGMFAAAWVTVGSEIMIGIITMAVIVYVAKHFPNLKIFSKALLASIVMNLAIYWLNLHVLLVILIGTLVYFVALYALGGINKVMLVSFFKRGSGV